jgi:O-methyltransferase involved in polyketide biosynthesis
VEDKASRILNAAEELLVSYGYRRITVDEVAHRAGVGKGTVHLYWPSKLELFGPCSPAMLPYCYEISSPRRRFTSRGAVMTQVRVRLDKAMETSLITLYGKAIDARMTPTILGDEMAVQAIEKIDYDFSRLKAMIQRVAPNAAARSKHFDDWTSEFLARHERATVVHLGAGLDPRVWRVNPGPGVTWYDVDYPDVIDAHGKLFPARENYRMIASSVTSPDWLTQVSTDLPTLIVAEGLTMFLRPEEGHELFRRIVDRFQHGVIAFDGQNWLGIRIMNTMLKRAVGTPLLHWAINDQHELERAEPRLHCIDAVSALSAPSSAALPWSTRMFTWLIQPIRPLRDLGLYFRYKF